MQVEFMFEKRETKDLNSQKILLRQNPEKLSDLHLSFLLCLSLSLSLCTLSACAQLGSSQKPPASHLKRTVAAAKQAEIPKEPIGIKEGEILLAYPRGENGNKIAAGSTFIVGAVPPGKVLSCNGEAVPVNQDGYFARVIKLNYGKNSFKLKLNGQEKELLLEIERPAPPPLLPAASFNILPESLEPRESIGALSQDLIEFAARATPGCFMSVQVGNRKIPMKAVNTKAGKNPSVNLGLATAFGVSYQHGPAALKDLYFAVYKIQPEDNFQNAPIIFTLQRGKQIIKAKAKGSISTVKQPGLWQTAHNNTIVRVAPEAARLTPLPEGVRMLSDGWRGENLRFELNRNHHVWIKKQDMLADDEINKVPDSKITTINMESDAYGACVSIPLSQKLPFQLEQDPKNKTLTLRIFGANADTDFVTADLRPRTELEASLIDYVSWKQKEDLEYELTVHMCSNQSWGYYADYKENTLNLHLKAAPAINPESGSLKGAIICVDPGHGGREAGSIGCSGAKEARINLEIASQLAKELEASGATVIMTRNDDSEVSLQDRVDTAIAARADLLLSIHNNALPDGRDPLVEKGSSSYWYHPQSIEIARLAQQQMVKTSGFKDYGSRYQNLALCRPTHMPATLLEVGFMINPDEFSRLKSAEFQKELGKALSETVKNWMLEKVKLQSAQSSQSKTH